MRVVIAGLTVFGLMLLAVAGLSRLGVFKDPAAPWQPGVVGGGLGLLLLLLSVLATMYSNWRLGLGWTLNGGREGALRRLEAAGMLVDTDYRARRAFEVEEIEDEGLQYFLELEDGSVLFLMGQYLYDYAPVTDDPEALQPRSFPCTEFTVRRHRKAGWAAELVCRGEVLVPEAVTPPFAAADFRADRVPEDGAILTDRTYAELLAERRAAR